MNARRRVSALTMGLLLAPSMTLGQGTSVQREVFLPQGSSAPSTIGTPQVLDNGWIVIGDGSFDVTGPSAVTDAGAFHVYEPDGTRRLTYTGRSANEGLSFIPLGGTRGAIYSRGWRNANGEAVGALMLVDLAEPLPDAITPANAIVGTRSGDFDTLTVARVGTQGFVIGVPRWDRGTLVDAGAARWVAFAGSTVGEITPANALVGRHAGDVVGWSVWSVGDSDWVAFSNWREGDVFDTFAMTQVVGGGAFVGEVSAANSLFGASPADRIGSGGLIRLPNGSLLVLSPWHDGPGEGDSGAITRLDPGVARIGPIGPDNSLLGRSLDRLGTERSVTMLPDGHIVITVPDANRNPLVQVGAVAFRRSDQPLTGWLDPTNALYGRVELDRVGSGGALALADGSYLLLSPNVDLPGIVDAGAATIGAAGVGVSGLVSAANSRVGRSAGDRIGSGGATALAQGGAVVLSPFWRSDAGVASAGAATLIRSAAETGPVDAGNSLVGATSGDFNNATVAALANGHYVVETRAWNGLPEHRGAVSWGHGVSGAVGAISPARSIVGRASTTGGGVIRSVIALDDGNYVIGAPWWTDTSGDRHGAAFWIDGSAPSFGPVDGFVGRATFGLRPGGRTGSLVFALRGGGHLVWTEQFDGPGGVFPALTHIVAAPFHSTLVTPDNSLFGGSSLGGGISETAPFIEARDDGSWIASTPVFTRPGGSGNVGAMTFGWADRSTVGVIGPSNSVIGDFAPWVPAEAPSATSPVAVDMNALEPMSVPPSWIVIRPSAVDRVRNTLIVRRAARPGFVLMWPGLETTTRLRRLEAASTGASVDAIVRVASSTERPSGRIEIRDRRGHLRCATADGVPVDQTIIEFRCTIDTSTIAVDSLTAEFFGYPRFAFSRSTALELGQFVDGFER
jgi:hypothetical protein